MLDDLRSRVALTECIGLAYSNPSPYPPALCNDQLKTASKPMNLKRCLQDVIEFRTESVQISWDNLEVGFDEPRLRPP